VKKDFRGKRRTQEDVWKKKEQQMRKREKEGGWRSEGSRGIAPAIKEGKQQPGSRKFTGGTNDLAKKHQGSAKERIGKDFKGSKMLFPKGKEWGKIQDRVKPLTPPARLQSDEESKAWSPQSGGQAG